MEKRINKKKIIEGAATVAVLASLVAGMLFSGATEVTQEQTQMQVNRPPIVMDIDEFANATVDDDDEDATEQKRSGARQLLIAPLSLIGTALMTVASFLLRLLLASPIGVFILTALISWGALVGVYAGTAKLLFPDLPLRKILTKKAVGTLGIVALGIAGIDAAAPLFWDKYPLVSGLVKLGIGATAIGLLLRRRSK